MALIANIRQRLFRWQSDGTAPTRLGQRRVFILPTGAGLLFAVALIVMLIGAINYTLALGHALVFLLAGIGLTGMVHTFRNLHGLTITPSRCEPVFVGEAAHFQLILGNDRTTPRLALELEAEPGAAIRADIPAGEIVHIHVPLVTRQRGWLALPRVRLWSIYPLGLFRAWSYLQPEMRCLVYPAPHFSQLPDRSPSLAAGEQGNEGGEEDFAGFRHRQPADSPRHVAWKASARDNDRPLLVKQFAGGTEGELRLDWQLTDPALATETRLSILAGWVLAAETTGGRYALRLPGSDIASGFGEQHRRRCLEALALYPR